MDEIRSDKKDGGPWRNNIFMFHAPCM